MFCSRFAAPFARPGGLVVDRSGVPKKILTVEWIGPPAFGRLHKRIARCVSLSAMRVIAGAGSIHLAGHSHGGKRCGSRADVPPGRKSDLGFPHVRRFAFMCTPYRTYRSLEFQCGRGYVVKDISVAHPAADARRYGLAELSVPE